MVQQFYNYLCFGFGKRGSPVTTPILVFSLVGIGMKLFMVVCCSWTPSSCETETSLLDLSDCSGVTSASELPILELLLLEWSESTQTHSTFQYLTRNSNLLSWELLNLPKEFPFKSYLLSELTSSCSTYHSEKAYEHLDINFFNFWALWGKWLCLKLNNDHLSLYMRIGTHNRYL